MENQNLTILLRKMISGGKTNVGANNYSPLRGFNKQILAEI